MGAFKNADADRCLLATRKTENFDGSLALRTQSSKIPTSKGASEVRPTGRTPRCTSSKRPVLLEKGAKDLLRRPSLVSRGVVGVSITLDCVIPTDIALRWYSCGRSNGKIRTSLRLTVADFWSKARAEPCSMRFCKTCVVGITF